MRPLVLLFTEEDGAVVGRCWKTHDVFDPTSFRISMDASSPDPLDPVMVSTVVTDPQYLAACLMFTAGLVLAERVKDSMT